jgi:hypothetical protein
MARREGGPMRRLTAMLTGCLLAAGPVAAEPMVPLQGLGAAVGAWVAAEMGQPLPAALPRIDFAPSERMHALRFGPAEGSERASLKVVALYDDEGRTILLPEGWTGTTPAELSVLAHEMVHHLQNVSGRRYACGGEREAEAYDIQRRWLALFGATLEGSFELNPLTLMILTRCGL